MKITVKIQRTRQEKRIDIANNASASDVLKKMNINPTVVIITRNKEVITEDTILKNKDTLELLSVISGG